MAKDGPPGALHQACLELGATVPEVARAYRAHCCKEACQSNYLLYLEEDITEAVANARRLGVGLDAVGGGGEAGGNLTRTGGGGSFASVGVVVFKI